MDQRRSRWGDEILWGCICSMGSCPQQQLYPEQVPIQRCMSTETFQAQMTADRLHVELKLLNSDCNTEPKIEFGGFSPAAGCKLPTAQLHGWLSGEPVWRFTNSLRTGQMSNCSTIILRKFRLAGSIWIHLSWLLKFKFKTNPKYFTSISRLWDQPFLIFSAPTRLQWGTSGHLGHYLINWPAVLCISEGTGPLWATGVTRLRSGINGVKTPGGGLHGPLLLIIVVPVWEDCSFTHLSMTWNWFSLCLCDVI